MYCELLEAQKYEKYFRRQSFFAFESKSSNLKYQKLLTADHNNYLFIIHYTFFVINMFKHINIIHYFMQRFLYIY